MYERNLEALTAFPDCGLTGRRKILSPVKRITRDNIHAVLDHALSVHAQNAREIQYLYDVYKGKQDILQKEKIVREEINNKILINRANEIVTFKTSFLLSSPIQYVSHGDNSGEVEKLNEMMRDENKAAKDKELVDWFHICGVAQRLCLPDADGEREGAPFRIETLDPREAFVIYNSGIYKEPIGGVIILEDEDGEEIINVYTPYSLFKVKGDDVTEDPHIIGAVPIVEYVNNEPRIGAFEIVLSALNGINTLESNAVDSVEDFVNGFDVFQNCDIEDGDYADLGVGGKAVKIKTVTQGMEAKVYRIYSELNQSGVQTRIDDLNDSYLEICGMPNRNGGLSTSDTGTAVLYRDGWSAAAARANDTATLFKRSEREFNKLVLKICDMADGVDLNLKISDFEPKFPFTNLQNTQSLTQVFCELLNNDKVHPHDAYSVAAGLFKDVEESYRKGMDWYNEQQEKQLEELNGLTEQQRARYAVQTG